MDLQDALTKVIAWARLVGSVQRDKICDRHLIATKTTPFDLVTEVDRLSEQMIIERIRESYPGHAVIAEESGVFEEPSGYTWIIDPLDGTTNYAHRLPLFSVSIALARGRETLLGVVYIPVTGEMFYAVKGGGAFLNGERISVSSCTGLEQALLSTGFPYDVSGRCSGLHSFGRLMAKASGVRCLGTAAFELCCVACGRLDAYWELSLKLWDVAAGGLIVTEAGGAMIDISTTADAVAIVSGNQAMCDLLLKELAAAH